VDEGVQRVDAREFYDRLGEDYDGMVSWDARLKREEAFFKQLFAAERTRSVLDAACGTGMHAVAFARHGLRSAGADLSPAMITQARLNAERAGVRVELVAAGLGQISAALPGPFDAVTCLGNSLPHLLDDAALSACFTDFATLLAPHGVVVIQNRNYDRLLRERQRFMPVAARSTPDGETLFLRITDFSPLDAAPGTPAAEHVEFTILTLKKRGGAWSQTIQSTPLRALRRSTVEAALSAAGFTGLQAYGGYGKEPSDSAAAADLVVVARKAR
jgi:SAM-dependent methyltransferase